MQQNPYYYPKSTTLCTINYGSSDPTRKSYPLITNELFQGYLYTLIPTAQRQTNRNPATHIPYYTGYMGNEISYKLQSISINSLLSKHKWKGSIYINFANTSTLSESIPLGEVRSCLVELQCCSILVNFIE